MLVPARPRSPNPKKIGEYLSLKKQNIREILDLQKALEDRDIVKRFGEILVESGKITADKLHRALDRQKVDIMKLLPVIDNIERAVGYLPEDLKDNKWAMIIAISPATKGKYIA